ncbi:hypothetical protein ACFL2S_03815 [Thermodesulfobacteriota bacterium]
MITPVNEQTHVRMIPNLIGALGKIKGRPMIRYDLDYSLDGCIERRSCEEQRQQDEHRDSWVRAIK